jgi:hypothetical protein
MKRVVIICGKRSIQLKKVRTPTIFILYYPLSMLGQRSVCVVFLIVTSPSMSFYGFYIFLWSHLSHVSGINYQIIWSKKYRGVTAINVSDSITWTWAESTELNVESSSSIFSFESSPVVNQVGYNYTVFFNEPGVFPYRCGVYPSMRGEIQVYDAVSTSATHEPTSQPTALDMSAISELESPITINSFASIPKNWDVTFTVRTETVHTGPVSFTSRLYCIKLNCYYPAPTIQVRPGENLTITLVNALGDEPIDNSTDLNNMRNPNTTNFYVHGLHIDPTSNSPLRRVKPGESKEWTLSVQPNHAPGHHWYYSNSRGAAALHLMGGLFGSIFVLPDYTNPKVLNYPNSLKNAQILVLMISRLQLEQQMVDGEVSQSCYLNSPCNSSWQGATCDCM